jgi:ring-1,2-phenylacetyl-CoA epoxidase subunit PaaE
MSLYKTLRIIGIKTETAGCKTFFLAPVGGEPIKYAPGQFLTFVFPKPAGEERRSYSISSAPALQEPLSVTIKKVENGEYSRKLVDHAQVGDELISIGANGFFVLPADIQQYQQIFFLAAGSGITPVFSLIKTILMEHPHIQIVLIYSNRSRPTTIFYDELQQLSKQYEGRLLIEFLFSSAFNLERARLSKWLLGILLKEYLRAPLSKTLFYCCGPFDFMRMATIELLEDGVPLHHIRKENFSTFKPDIKIKPPDTDKHSISIHIGNDRYSIETQYPQTILQAAKKAGIILPYSCEAGKCGSCAANCISGQVWMSYNEVLLDEEIAKGRVLTCVGFPVGGDVELGYK